ARYDVEIPAVGRFDDEARAVEDGASPALLFVQQGEVVTGIGDALLERWAGIRVDRRPPQRSRPASALHEGRYSVSPGEISWQVVGTAGLGAGVKGAGFVELAQQIERIVPLPAQIAGSDPVRRHRQKSE